MGDCLDADAKNRLKKGSGVRFQRHLAASVQSDQKRNIRVHRGDRRERREKK